MPLAQPIYVSNPDAFQPASADDIQPCGAPVFSCPFPGDNTPYILKQDFMCLANYFALLPLNTPYSFDIAYDDFVLCEESEREDIGGGVVKWTRTYAKIPASQMQPTSFSYNFIGFAQGGEDIDQRERFIETVPAAIVSEFFLIGDGAPYGTILQVPVLPAQTYVVAGGTILLPIDYLLPAGSAIYNTVPTLEDYAAWTENEDPSDVPDGNLIVAQDSTLQRWLGNIIERQTVKIRAR